MHKLFPTQSTGQSPPRLIFFAEKRKKNISRSTKNRKNFAGKLFSATGIVSQRDRVCFNKNQSETTPIKKNDLSL